jgi:hypothetical protein
MVSTQNLQELGSDFYIVSAILDDLDTALANIVGSPSVFVQVVALFTRMSALCVRLEIKHMCTSENKSCDIRPNDM